MKPNKVQLRKKKGDVGSPQREDLLVDIGTNHIASDITTFLFQLSFGSKFHCFNVITVAMAMKSIEKSVAFSVVSARTFP